MKRRPAHFFIALFLMPAACVPMWRNVTSDEAGFTIEFPGTPEERFATQESPFGNAELRHFAFVAGRWSPSWVALYAVSAIKLTAEPRNAEEAINWQYDEMREAFGTNYDGGGRIEIKVLDERTVTVDGQTGRALTIVAPDGVRTYVRIYCADGIIYTLLVDDENEDRAMRFLESFKLL